MSRVVYLLAVLSMAGVLILAGCGQGTSANGSSGAAGPTSTSTAKNTASATLKHVPVGTANIGWDPTSHGLTVKLSLVGLAPSSTHPANINSGSCVKKGPVVYPLNNVLADARGVGSSTTVINNVKTIPASGWFVNVHNGPGLATPDEAVSIACNDLALPNVSTTKTLSVQVPLNAAPGSAGSEMASGTARLALSGSTLTVKLTLSGLQPHSSHAAHIHAGSCLNQGGAVIYPLTNVVAGATGNASETTTIKNVKSIPASGWYVNVHYGTNISTQTGFNPIACGNVTPG
ncbi:MAG TPA: CHRD domain-containing protein [Ktedonobacteraceae bacterium]